jgi:hypothetical protein
MTSFEAAEPLPSGRREWITELDGLHDAFGTLQAFDQSVRADEVVRAPSDGVGPWRLGG